MKDYDDETEKALEYYRSHRKRLEAWGMVKGIFKAIFFTVLSMGLPAMGIFELWDCTGTHEFWIGIFLGVLCAGTFVTWLDIFCKEDGL